MFVDKGYDFWNELAGNGAGAFTTTRSAVAKDAVLPGSVLIGETAPVNLVGVLKGDVNGKWAAPADSSSLGADYFQALVAA